MPALNRVQLIGRLGKDPEARFTPTGKQVVTFSLAVSNHWKSGGESKESTDWFNIEVWEKLGEVCQKYLHKGSLVFLEGRLKTDKYDDKGETKYFTKVVVQSMQMLDRKPEEDAGLAIEEAPAGYEA